MTYLTRSDTCVMNAEIDETSGMLPSADSFFTSDDVTLELPSITGAEFEDFSTTALDLRSRFSQLL